MPSDSSNDNGPRHATDACGQAALLLVESLIHGLIARKVISVSDAVEIVEVAAEAEAEIEAGRHAAPAPPRQSAALLEAISGSLSHDLAGDV
ncbi:MAG: hypothetical protein ACK4FB_05830 [Brevundimonas sp.]|uniref:hypothetical protein n=1 Tax=Brevundimonas sp. TaxID=1871086 RepID=UPI00391B5574